MHIELIQNDKKRFLDLLLLGDEQENMIDKYLEHGDLFALYDPDLKSIAVVTQIQKSNFELKNIATYRQFQKQTYGRSLIKHILVHYKNKGKSIYVGTGDIPSIINFYLHCGFKISHRVKNFFTENYDHPIFENGIQLIDMVYLKQDL